MSEDITPYNVDFNNGYKAGFGDGWDAAKQTFERYLRNAADQTRIVPPTPVMPQGLQPYKLVGCTLCGIGENGDPLGYACQHPSCPSRTTFNRTMDDWWNTQTANCDTTTTNTLSGL